MTITPWHNDNIPPPPITTLNTYLNGLEADKKRWHDASDFPMRRIAAAPVTTVFNLEEAEVREIADASRSFGIHMHTHLSENDTYVSSTMDRFGQRPVDWMADQGWIGPDVWYAHLVKVNTKEMDRLAEAGTAMAHCPQSNARLGSGIAPAPEFARRGGIVSLAVDGTAANEAGDMAQAIYTAFILHRSVGQAESTSAEEVMHWATAGGAQALGIPGISTLEVGKAADIVMLSLAHPRYFGQHDPAIGTIISGGEFFIHRSFVQGNPIVIDNKIPGIDLHSLSERARQAVERLILAKKRQAR